MNEPLRSSGQRARRALLFLNPRSRQGAARAADVAVRSLEESGLAVIRVPCATRADMGALIQQHAQDSDLVVVGGGDGTVNAALKGVVAARLPLGILPLGTANDLARTLGIPGDPSAAAKLIAIGKTRRIDVGRVNDQLFLNVASLGLSVELTRQLTGKLKRRWGRLNYPIAATRALVRAKPFVADIVQSGRRERIRSLQIAVGNGVYYGGGMAVYEAANIDDGCLDFYSLDPTRLWRLPLLFLAVRSGRNRSLPGVKGFCSAGPLEIHTKPSLPINTDGEITTATPAAFSLLPGALAVFAPPGRWQRTLASPAEGPAGPSRTAVPGTVSTSQTNRHRGWHE